MKKYFTSESVTEGHPDKVCDRISDSVLDALLQTDPNARAAVECCAAYNTLFMAGEVTSTATVDYEKIARDVIKKIGYDFGGFGYDKCSVITLVHGQSPDIAQGVNSSEERRACRSFDALDAVGAGDQGMMFGYACRETEELMPLPIVLAHKLAQKLTEVRRTKLKYLRPDGKTQVTVEYEGRTPKRVAAVVVSAQHEEHIPHETIESDLKQYVIGAVIPKELLDGETKYFINPTGKFVIGGPEGDSGLTGRKIVVDTYGGRCAHGGGAFSGKDCTKVDRSAAYMARYVCKNLVAAGLCEEVELQIAYAIGVARPVSVFVETYGTGKLPDGEIADIVVKEFDLRPAAIIETLGLRRPIYAATSAYGHFGRKEFAWEQTDKAETLKRYLK